MNPSKGGRPQKPNSEHRINRVTASFTEYEYIKLTRIATNAGIRPAQLLRDMCFCELSKKEFIVTPVNNDVDNAKIKLVAIKTLLKQTVRLVKLESNSNPHYAKWLKPLETRIRATEDIIKTLD